MDRIVRIAGASSSMGDSAESVPQLLKGSNPDYIIFDYLSEGQIGILSNMAEADPTAYPTYLVDQQVGPFLREIHERGIKIIANAGGNNPRGLADAVEKLAASQGFKMRVASVQGDDLRARAAEFAKDGYKEMFTGEAFPEKFGILNCYLGALPIAAALDDGADMVITGRVVDSATTLGALIHEFGWKADQYDLLAAGSLAGHLLECGTMVTGGTHTDWHKVPGWENTGWPIGECRADGSVVITKTENSGGLINIGVVAEQLIYEISDPQCYFLPDVTCDFSQVKLLQQGENRVHVSGAKGYPPTSTYKTNGSVAAGWRGQYVQPIVGFDAVAKAKRFTEASFIRIGNILRRHNLGPFTKMHDELIGTEMSYGAQAQQLQPREVMARLVVEHDEKDAVDIFCREVMSGMTSMSVGTPLGLYGPPSRIWRIFMFLLPKDKVEITMTLDGKTKVIPVPTKGGFKPEMIVRPTPPAAPTDIEAGLTVRLIDLAWGRSGDKGNLFNVGIIARKPEYLPYIRAALTAEAVGEWYRHVFADPERRRVDRYDLPGFHAINLVVHESLGGGNIASARLDAFAKTMSQQLLEFAVPVSRALHSEVQRTREYDIAS